MAKTIIHIGMPRTGSTFLQRSVFPMVPNFFFADLQYAHYSDAFQKLQFQDESLYNVTAIKTETEDFSQKNSILSNENFVGQSLFLASTNRTRNAQRLKELFPDAEILLILRNQVDLLQSLYAISVYGDIDLKPEKFIHFGESTPGLKDKSTALYRTHEPVEHAENYLYTPLISLYKGLFKKVHLLLFEQFAKDQSVFIQKLEHIFGQSLPQIHAPSANSSPGHRQLAGMRNLNKLSPLLQGETGKKVFRKAKNYLEHSVSPGEKFEFKAELKDRIKGYFKTDNTQLIQDYPELFEDEFRQKYSF